MKVFSENGVTTQPYYQKTNELILYPDLSEPSMSHVLAETTTERRLECVETRFQSSGLDASPGVQKGRDPRTCGRDYISHLEAWERLSVLPEEMGEVVGGEDGLEPPSLMLRLLLPLPWMRIRSDGTIQNSVID